MRHSKIGRSTSGVGQNENPPFSSNVSFHQLRTCRARDFGRGEASRPARRRAAGAAEKQAAKKYLAPNCVPKDTVPFEVPHCLRRR